MVNVLIAPQLELVIELNLHIEYQFNDVKYVWTGIDCILAYFAVAAVLCLQLVNAIAFTIVYIRRTILMRQQTEMEKPLQLLLKTVNWLLWKH